MKMKRLFFAVITAAFAFGNMNAQTGWTLSSPYIYSTVNTDRVGIGTTTPAYGLQIKNIISAGNISTGSTFGVGLQINDAAAVGQQTADKHAVFGCVNIDKDILFPTFNGTSFDERMRINYLGNVGIGTSTPGEKLEVSGNIYANAEGTFVGADAAGNSRIGFVKKAGTYPVIATGSATPMIFGIWSTTNLGGGNVSSGSFSEKMRLLTTGNLGIGTTTPASKLDIEGNLAVGNTYSGTTAAPANGAIIEGKVGIGQPSPSYQLDVFTNTLSQAVHGVIATGSGSNYAGSFSASGGGSTNYGVYANATGATTNYSLYLGSLSASANNYSLYSVAAAKSYIAGDLGIGTPSPTATLDINGTAKCTASAWSSDQQFKTNIDSIQNALAIIKQLKPKTYYFDTANVWGLNFPSAKQHGFVAQDLEQILPEIVATSSKPEEVDSSGNIVRPALTYKSVYYIELIAFLTKGIQEQQQKIDSLQAKVNNQDLVNSELQNQITTNTIMFENRLNELQASINNCCNATRSMHIGSIEPQSQPLQQIDVKLNDAQSIVLEQNVPNPFAEQTTINYTLPDNTGKAQMLFYNSNGKLIQSIELVQKGKGQLNVFANDLTNGIYTYTLVVDSKIISTKKMIKQ
jgi:hypothetical protein